MNVYYMKLNHNLSKVLQALKDYPRPDDTTQHLFDGIVGPCHDGWIVYIHSQIYRPQAEDPDMFFLSTCQYMTPVCVECDNAFVGLIWQAFIV